MIYPEISVYGVGSYRECLDIDGVNSLDDRLPFRWVSTVRVLKGPGWYKWNSDKSET